MNRKAYAQLLAMTTVLAAVLATIVGLLVANHGATTTALIWAGAAYAATVLGIAAVTERPGATMLVRSVMLLAGVLIAAPGALLLNRAGIRIRVAL